MNIRHRQRGMALIGALAFLVLFTMLGTAYIGYMSIEYEGTELELHQVRARNLAVAGIYAAIGEIGVSIADGEQPAGPYPFDLAAYRMEGGERGAYPQTVTVSVSDEAARVNLNHAPGAVLRSLGLAAAGIEKLDAFRNAASGNRLATVDEVLARGITDSRAFKALDTGLLTVYTAEDPRQPHAYINLNTASPAVLAALFNIGQEEAQSLASSRPFTSWSDTVAKVGREPATFNVPVPRHAPRDMPSALAFDSHTYRLRSTVALDMPGGSGRPERAAVEAVVLFHEGGGYTIRYWKELRGGDVEPETQPVSDIDTSAPPVADETTTASGQPGGTAT